MSNYLYTIIIPHFNIPDLLMRCIKSIPVRDDVQVIVVDDCSPNFPSYLELYPELSRPYLELYSTEKGGSAGRARNVGLSYAKGKWLIFADADDLFSDGLDAILDKYYDDVHDILYFNCDFVSSKDVTKVIDRNDSYIIKQLFENESSEMNARCLCPVPWGKIIKKSLVESIGARFDETKWSNDIVFSALVGCTASSVIVINEVLYKVTSRELSLTSNFCFTRDELIVRTIESLRAQQIIDHYYGDCLTENVYLPFIQRSFRSSGNLFWTIVLDLKSYGISRSKVLRQMASSVGQFRLIKSFARYSLLEHFKKFQDYYSYKAHVLPLQFRSIVNNG